MALDRESARRLSAPERRQARELLEASAIHWRRDWDALVLGFILGLVTALALGATVRVVMDPPEVWTHEHSEGR